MPTFTLNGTAVELVPQERDAFSWLASQVYRRLHDGAPLPAILTVFAHEGVNKENLELTDPRIQSILWTLWQLGVASTRVEGEGEARQVKWERGEHDNIDKRPIVDHFTEDGLRDGRALAAGLVIVHGRKISVNGTDMPVRVNNFELVKAQAAEMEKRRANPTDDPSLAAAMYLAELLAQGADQNDLRLRAVLELAADLAIRSIVVDVPSRQLRMDGFNEQAALAGAFFQGAPVEHFKIAIDRAQALNKMAAEAAAKLAGKAKAGGVGASQAAALASPGRGQAKESAKQTDSIFKRRRR